MKVTVIRKYYLNSEELQIKQLMQSAGFDDNEWEDEKEVEIFLQCMSEDDLKEYSNGWTNDIEIEK